MVPATFSLKAMPPEDILTNRQRKTLQLFAAEEDFAGAYVLSGGTALAAFYLRHRLSEDLDFFTQQPVDDSHVQKFVGMLKTELGALHVQAKKLYDRRIFALLFPNDEELKMEFTEFPHARLEEPLRKDGILVESLRDIAAGKLAAILDRFEAKDYVDLHFLLKHGMDIRGIWSDVQKKFQLLHGPMQVGSALMRARNLPALPRMLLPVTREDIALSLAEVARSLRSDVLEE